MGEFYLAALSEFNHQEGYLNLALEDLVLSGLASKGIGGDRNHLITILYDEKNNPYLLFNARHLNDVKKELKKRIIRAEGAFKIDFEHLNDALSSEIHSKIQDIYTPQLLYTTNFN